MEVLLGMLAIEPMSGYDLGMTIRSSVGYFWNESYGQIYPNLKRLAAAGLVNSKTERHKGKPDRRVYSITKKGRERLKSWLSVEPQPEIPRNEMLLKLFFGEHVPAEVPMGYVEREAEVCRALLGFLEREAREGIDKNRHYPGAPYWRMAVRFGELEMRAHLLWADETLVELKKMAGKKRNHGRTKKEKSHAGR
jgi:DNA-binding PadR family transcriptional regulator